MIFQAKNASTLQWTLTDDTGAPINDALVKATLYRDRSSTDPDNVPGTPVPPINNLTLAYVSNSAGVYSGDFDNSLDPQPNADGTYPGFTLVIDASIASVPVYHQEEISYVSNVTGSINDLVDLDTVKKWLGIPQANTDCDAVIQLLITGFSTWVLHRTGIDSFNRVVRYVEIYDGNGNNELFLRNSPIVTLNSLQIGALQVGLSTGLTVPGIYITQEKRSIAFRSAGYGWMTPSSIFPYRFIYGKGNIQVDYNAGYVNTPWDLTEACMKAVAINYRRKDWIDLASKQLSVGGQASGSTRYRDWALPPEIEETLEYYSRYAHS